VKILLPLLLALTFLALPAVSAASCLTSSEEYAVEVVVPNYDLSSAMLLAERIEGNYIKLSEYSPNNILVLLKETELPTGLSVRLQIPTEIKEVEEPYIKILSSSAKGQLPAQVAQVIAGWRASCGDQSCLFNKDNLALTATRTSGPELTLEISRLLNTCSESCSGFCFSSTSTSRCLDNQIRSDLNNLLRITRLAANTEELFESYRIVGTENIIVLDILPTKGISVDWREAMRQELVALSSKNAILLSKTDIEDIAQLAKRGQAGQNYRIVYDAETDNWNYYNVLPDAILTDKRDCQAYRLLAEDIKNSPETANLFYLVPIIITIAGVLLLGLLAIIANLILRHNHRREKRRNAHRLHR